MINEYALLKFAHILIAILALGTSAGLGIVLELYGSDREHGRFILHVIWRIVAYFVLPGYILMLGTGLLMANLAWPTGTSWIHTAMILWSIGLLALLSDIVVMRKQMGLFDAGESSSSRYRAVSYLGRVLGAAAGLVVVAILYLMVFKP